MTHFKTLFGAAVLAFAATQSSAESRVGAGLSTFGPTLEYQTAISDNFTVRGSWSGGLSLSDSGTVNSVDYTATGKLGGLTLTGQYHLPAGMRIGGGLFSSTSSLSGTASVPNGAPFGGGTATQDYSFSSVTTFQNSLSPMVNTGFDIPFFGGTVLSTDLGVIWTGGFDVEYTDTTAGGSGAPQGQIDTEEAALENSLSRFEYVPYVSVMLGKWF